MLNVDVQRLDFSSLITADQSPRKAHKCLHFLGLWADRAWGRQLEPPQRAAYGKAEQPRLRRMCKILHCGVCCGLNKTGPDRDWCLRLARAPALLVWSLR